MKFKIGQSHVFSATPSICIQLHKKTEKAKSLLQDFPEVLVLPILRVL